MTASPELLLDQLNQLRSAPPSPLAERMYVSVVRVEGPEAVGALFVAFTEQGINYVRPAGDEEQFAAEARDRFDRPIRLVDRPPRRLTDALRTGRGGQLDYDLRALSAFEQAVLRKALEIPRGETRPYGWVAAEIGRHRAVRAVGTALGRNPVPFLIPCHRVVRSDGTEGQYGFGPDMKRELLTAEQVNLDEIRTLAARGTHYLGSDTTHVVCYPSCHQARRIAPDHRVGFRSVTQAVTAGYRPCGRCRPSLAMSA
ncbi:MAG: methylated-DNA--[protein]-cysteine S-methyltransferase [Actinomycetota bacterium]|nr:methylated-DNA--[protein]-cysteine S-methyltransferase [Actinomycetota bacterium]MDQ6947188.1 methylated-DNA--[protein]-cysteine S-methyltransferase [Actinomycetota bacterium]